MLAILIFFLGFLMRFFSLGANPPSLTWDEVAWGYNAYTIGIDGRDEFGKFLPVTYIESFGDFKPPVYAYLTVLPVRLLGLNEFAVRLPSAFFGSLSVILVYFLTRRIFPSSSNKKWYALAASSIFALSPWHINLSRAAFEANVATFFLLLGVLLFLIAVQGRKIALPFSVLSFVATIYTFNTTRVVAPLLVLVLLIGFRKKLFAMKKITLLSGFIGILVLLPTVGFLLSPQAGLRYKEVNIFTDKGVVERSNQEIANDHGAIWSNLLHNRRVGYAREYVKHYFDNLNPNFLFIKGDGNPKFSIQEVGQLYLWEVVPFLIGLLYLFKKKEGSWWILPVWLVMGIIPAATARETPHALRIETTLPTFQILTGYGVVWLVQSLKDIHSSILGIKVRYLLLGVGLAIISSQVLYYVHDYYAQYPYEYSAEWQYGYKESIAYANSMENHYDKILVTSELGRPYAYYLFYSQTDPAFFRKTAIIQRDAFGFVTVEGFGKYRFGKTPVTLGKSGEKNLYIDLPANVPEGAHVKKTFPLLNGDPSMVAYEL